MIGELDFYGLLISPLLPLTLAALLICAVLRRVLGWIGFYRVVWHRALFDFALLVLVLGGLVAATAGWNPS
jgi:protein AaeX